MAVVCAAAVLPRAVVRLVPYSSHCSAGEYCCHVVHCSLAGCVVCGWVCVCVLFVWWGILCLLPPSLWWWVGALWVVGGMTMEGWLCRWCPPSCSLGGLVEGRWGVCRDVPVLRWVPCLRVALSSLCCPRSSSVLCCGWGSVVACVASCGTVSRYSLPPLCLLSHHCWFRGVSLWHGCVICGMAVMIMWGGKACGVYCLHVIRVAVCVSVVCVL